MHSFIKTSVLALAIIATGCAFVPEQIEVADDTNLVSFENVIGGNETAKGASARWGGEIINVENKKEYSEIEILHYPSNNFGKPRSTLNSQGRFKVRVAGFIDPLVFEKGRLITFLGEIGEPAEGIIGEQTYVYPVLVANGYYMWKETEEYEVSGFYYSPLSPYWGLGFGNHYRGHYGFYNRHYGFYNNIATVKIKTKNSSSSRVQPRQNGRDSNKVRASGSEKPRENVSPKRKETEKQK